MHNEETLKETMGCVVEPPEESHCYASITKHSAYNTANGMETSLKTSGTKLLGVSRPKMNFM